MKRCRMPYGCISGGFRFLLFALLFVFVSKSLEAQTSGQSNEKEAFLENAARAFAHGNRDEVETLAERFDSDMPEVVAFRARLLIDRGDYAQAEALLRPVVDDAQETAAGLQLGLLLQTQGQIQEARALLDSVMVNGLRSFDPFEQYQGALAARAVGSFREANRLFRAAAQGAPDDPAIQTSWGELFLEKYNHPDALASFQAALALDDQWAPAHLGVAQVLVSENPPVARSSVDRALEIDPSFVNAHLFVAELALDDSNRDAAGIAIADALAINPRSLEARSYSRPLPTWKTVLRITKPKSHEPMRLTLCMVRFIELLVVVLRGLIDFLKPCRLSDLPFNLTRTIRVRTLISACIYCGLVMRWEPVRL
ncbi:MAG: tetratricopeptide repeat protein [Vicinamibacterales bacterium]